jgi:hypothetical protein
VLRLGGRANKYALWAGLAVALHYARPALTVATVSTVSTVVAGAALAPGAGAAGPEPLGLRLGGWAASVAAVLLLGRRKVRGTLTALEHTHCWGGAR